MKNLDVLRLVVAFLIFLVSFPLTLTGAPMLFTLSLQCACMVLIPVFLYRVLKQAFENQSA